MPKGHTNNPNGRPQGTKNVKTLQWEALGEALTDMHAERFNEILAKFMNSNNPETQEIGCRMYIQVLEYFKPKQARHQHAGDATSPIQVVVSDHI